MSAPLKKYDGMCGSCKHFEFLERDGRIYYRGYCRAHREGASGYRQASDSCKKYEDGRHDDKV